MLYLILCILFNALLVFIFKLYQVYRIRTFQAIVINYVICLFTGALFDQSALPIITQNIGASWMWASWLLGSLFIGGFYLIAITTQRIGVSAATVAMKTSLVIPVLFSLLILQNTLKDYTFLNYLGMALALVAIVVTSRRSKTEEVGSLSLMDWALPVIVFFSAGAGDVIINYTNDQLLQPEQAGAFTISTFAASAAIGSLVLLYQVIVKKVPFEKKNLVAGIGLGIPNFFSIYFLVKALSAFQNDGAFLYPVNNIGIILVATLGGMLFFKERLTKSGWFGLLLAVTALLLISYQEVVQILF
ncbi:hypothetical protein [Rufibacter roseus]|uniref:EamA/RhaT family transporter n=1 Tax=Rufibacter roseus TaxID=1567108 RepID=A0ABW2DIZ7_9BACT|nr:hypothetical protein [Rufibacter roseus]